jgi:hypothetical protein
MSKQKSPEIPAFLHSLSLGALGVRGLDAAVHSGLILKIHGQFTDTGRKDIIIRLLTTEH